MALTYVEYFNSHDGGVGTTLTVSSISVAVGDLVVVMAATEDSSTAPITSISNTGTTLSFNAITTVSATSNCYVRGWYATATAAETISVSVVTGGLSAKMCSVVVHTGAHATTPIPAGNIYSGSSANDASQSITPTASGSCLWMVLADWTQSNALTANANCSVESSCNFSGRFSGAIFRPTTQPRTDANAFTIGEASDADSTETTSWIAFEVRAAPNPTAALTTQDPSSGITEANIVAGGTKVILTLTDDTWITNTPVTPVIESGDATLDGDNATTPTTPWAMNTPALATGDLIIAIVAWDDSVDNTSISLANGPNSETWTQINSVVASNSTEVRMTAYYTVATNTWASGSINVTPNANEQWTSCVLKVPAGEFDSSTPIGASGTAASAGTAETSVTGPSFTAGSTDGGGRYIWAGAADADPQTTLSSGYTSIDSTDRGQVSLSVQSRDSAVTNSESISGGTRTIAGDSWCSVGFVVRDPTTSPFENARAAIASGLDSAQAEATGWDAKVKPNIPVANVVRTSNTVCTITLQAQSDYNITAQETITATIPAAALTGNSAIVATPTFTVDTGTATSYPFGRARRTFPHSILLH